MSFQRELFDQIGVPIAMGSAVGIATALGAQPLTDYYASVGLFVGAGAMVIISITRTPKRLRPFAPVRMENRAEKPAVNAKLVEKNTTIELKTEDGNQANYYHLTRLQREFTERIAFHLIYLQGHISNRYLIDGWHICKDRPEVAWIKNLYLEQEWIELKGRTDQAGMRITKTGYTVFSYFARVYSPTQNERKQIRVVQKGGTSPTHTLHTHVRSPFPISEIRGTL